MGFKSKAAVAVSGALTAGAFATLAAAVPASAATYGTEQSEGGVVFSVGNNEAIVGANHTGRSTEFTQTQQGNRVIFRTSNNQCVTDSFGGLSLQHCNNSPWQRFDEVGFGPFAALQNDGSHQYVTEHGTNRQVTTENVRRDRRGRPDFTRAQEWKWTTFTIGGTGGGGGGFPGGSGFPGHPVTASSVTKVNDEAAPGNGSPVSWARLNFFRQATVTLQGPANSFHCNRPGPCYAYTATLSDNGSLGTIPFSLTPNQSGLFNGHHEASPSVNGTYHGTTNITFYATSAHPVGHPGVGTQHDNGHSDDPTSWVLPFFGPGTHVAGAAVANSDYEFATSHQHWSDHSSDNGQRPIDGNIDGH